MHVSCSFVSHGKRITANILTIYEERIDYLELICIIEFMIFIVFALCQRHYIKYFLVDICMQTHYAVPVIERSCTYKCMI